MQSFYIGSTFTQVFCKKLQDEYQLSSENEEEADLEFILSKGKDNVQSRINDRLKYSSDCQTVRWECSALSKYIRFKKIHELEELPAAPTVPNENHLDSPVISVFYPFIEFLTPIIGFILISEFFRTCILPKSK